MALFHCVVWLGSARLGSALSGRDYSRCYSCAASTAVTPEKLFLFRVAPSSSRWIRSSAMYERNVCTSSTDHETAIFRFLKKGALIQNSCVRSFSGCADLNLAGLLCLVLQVQWRRQWRFSPANQWSAEFTRHVLVTVRFAWNLNWGGIKKVPGTRYCTQWKTSQKWTVPCSVNAPKMNWIKSNCISLSQIKILWIKTEFYWEIQI